jgi:hypothetical protein
MTTPSRKRFISVFVRAVVTALFFAGAALSGRFAGFWDSYGFLFIIVGAPALILLGFPASRIREASRYAARGAHLKENDLLFSYFWEALGRNFWILGVLGSVISFVSNLVTAQGGIQDMAFRLASSFRPAVYGLMLGTFCGLPALKLRAAGSPSGLAEEPKPAGQSPARMGSFWRIESGIGLLLMAGLLFILTIFRLGQSPTRNFPARDFFLDWTAVLVVAGGTFVLMMFLWSKERGDFLTIAATAMGFIGAIVGFVRVILAIARGVIADVAGSIAFISSSCFLALLIMALLGGPLADWEKRSSRTPTAPALVRICWYVFPFLVLIFLVLAFVLVITPFQKPA